VKEDVYIEMEVKGIILDPYTSSPVVLLKDMEGKQVIPIWIGILEAGAIAAELEKVALSRPMTHDLLKRIVDTLGAEVSRVEVSDLRDNVFYGNICLKKGRREFSIDARPSDAIAIALKSDSPIFVSEKVIRRSRMIDLTEKGKEEWGDVLERLQPEDFGKYKM
jgi:bifunctional DNase/RNase